MNAPQFVLVLNRGWWHGPHRFKVIWDGPDGLLRWEYGATLKQALHAARRRADWTNTTNKENDK